MCNVRRSKTGISPFRCHCCTAVPSSHVSQVDAESGKQFCGKCDLYHRDLCIHSPFWHDGDYSRLGWVVEPFATVDVRCAFCQLVDNLKILKGDNCTTTDNVNCWSNQGLKNEPVDRVDSAYTDRVDDTVTSWWYQCYHSPPPTPASPDDTSPTTAHSYTVCRPWRFVS